MSCNTLFGTAKHSYNIGTLSDHLFISLALPLVIDLEVEFSIKVIFMNISV